MPAPFTSLPCRSTQGWATGGRSAGSSWDVPHKGTGQRGASAAGAIHGPSPRVQSMAVHSRPHLLIEAAHGGAHALGGHQHHVDVLAEVHAVVLQGLVSGMAGQQRQAGRTAGSHACASQEDGTMAETAAANKFQGSLIAHTAMCPHLHHAQQEAVGQAQGGAGLHGSQDARVQLGLLGEEKEE